MFLFSSIVAHCIASTSMETEAHPSSSMDRSPGPEPVKINAANRHPHQFQIHEQLVLMIDQVLQIAEQKRQEQLAVFHENRGYLNMQVRIPNRGKPLVNTRAVSCDPAHGLAR